MSRKPTCSLERSSVHWQRYSVPDPDSTPGDDGRNFQGALEPEVGRVLLHRISREGPPERRPSENSSSPTRGDISGSITDEESSFCRCSEKFDCPLYRLRVWLVVLDIFEGNDGCKEAVDLADPQSSESNFPPLAGDDCQCYPGLVELMEHLFDPGIAPHHPVVQRPVVFLVGLDKLGGTNLIFHQFLVDLEKGDSQFRAVVVPCHRHILEAKRTLSMAHGSISIPSPVAIARGAR